MKNTLLLLLLIGLMACESTDGDLMDLGVIDEMVTIPITEMVAEGENFIGERKLIKNGRLQFETKNLLETTQNLKRLTQTYGGYITDESSEDFDERNWNRLTIRVPTQSFERLLNGTTKGVSKFDIKEVTAQDVTEEYTDLQSRITAKKKIEQRFLEILKTAKTVEDVLKVEAEAGKVREEIERTEGRLKFLTHQTSMSTLSIGYYQVIPVTTPSENTFLNRVKDGFKTGITLISSLILALVNIWPFILLAGIGYLIYRKKSGKVSQA